jgi:hypothetical protein
MTDYVAMSSKLIEILAVLQDHCILNPPDKGGLLAHHLNMTEDHLRSAVKEVARLAKRFQKFPD